MKNMLVPSVQIMQVVLIIIYIVALLAVQYDLVVLFAGSPPVCMKSFVPEESCLMHSSGRILYSFALYMVFWILQRRSYINEVLAATDGFVANPPPPMGWHDDNVKD